MIKLGKIDGSWIDVNAMLPMQEYKESNIIGEFLVTVELNDPDPNDDPEVMVLQFLTGTNTWHEDYNTDKPYEKNHAWHVIAWLELPKPYNKVYKFNKKVDQSQKK